MTFEEANEILMTVEAKVPVDKADEYYRAIIVSREALEKQIPKKVKNKMNDYGICPVCEHSFVGEMKYCTKCGQALDWS